MHINKPTSGDHPPADGSLFHHTPRLLCEDFIQSLLGHAKAKRWGVFGSSLVASHNLSPLNSSSLLDIMGGNLTLLVVGEQQYRELGYYFLPDMMLRMSQK